MAYNTNIAHDRHQQGSNLNTKGIPFFECDERDSDCSGSDRGKGNTTSLHLVITAT